MNVAEVKKYMDRVGVTGSGFTPKTSVKKLDEIKTQEVEAPVVAEMQVTEIEVQDAA